MAKNKKNLFTKSLQVNARVKGRYEVLAAEAENRKCVFCDLREKYIIKEDSDLVLTVNIFPYINGHLLIIPRRHVENFSEITPEEILAYQRLANDGTRVLKKELGIESFWLLLREGPKAGKAVKHLHWQVMPFTEEIVTWHYQNISLAPIDLAIKLRSLFKHEGS